MKFCSSCGSAEIVYKTPKGDNRNRHLCRACDSIFYENPKIVAGCIPVWENKVLMCRRAIEPRYGLWTLPAGFMENDETTVEAAERETREEACTNVVGSRLFALFNLPQINQVYMVFLSRLVSPEFAPGEESLDCNLYQQDEVPWNEIAFPTITYSLKFFFEDRTKGDFIFHTGDIVREGSESRFFERPVLN